VAKEIPLVDLKDLGRDAAAFARELGAGLREFGFVGVRGHGVGDDVIGAALQTSRAFFALPEAVKLRYEVAGGAGQRGYTRLCVEKARDQSLADLKEFWHVGREVPRGHPLAAALLPNLWPSEVAGFKEAQLALFTALERVGARVLEGVARSLGLRDDWFEERINRGNSILRAIHYPPLGAELLGRPPLAGSRRPPISATSESSRRSRAAAHEDINLITLLVGSEEPGLEILTRGGEWIAVTTLPGTIVVNVGDMLQRLTNELLPSTTHRVVRPSPPWDARSRHSIPFFLHFNPDVVIEPLPTCITPDRPNRHPTPITAHDYLQQRLREIGLESY